MGVSVWVRIKQPIPGVDPLATSGKLLAKAMDVLDGAAGKLKVRPLSDFYSVSQKQAIAELESDELADEDFEALADDHVWWAPEEGLASVKALLRWVKDHPDRCRRPEDVVADLEDFQSILEAAVREGVEFNVAVSA